MGVAFPSVASVFISERNERARTWSCTRGHFWHGCNGFLASSEICSVWSHQPFVSPTHLDFPQTQAEGSRVCDFAAQEFARPCFERCWGSFPRSQRAQLIGRSVFQIDVTW